MTEVWVCYSGCIHEGGGTPHAIYDNREAAEAWLAEALAVRMEGIRGDREYAESRGREWSWDDEPKWYGDEDHKGVTVIYDTMLIKRYPVLSQHSPRETPIPLPASTPSTTTPE